MCACVVMRRRRKLILTALSRMRLRMMERGELHRSFCNSLAPCCPWNDRKMEAGKVIGSPFLLKVCDAPSSMACVCVWRIESWFLSHMEKVEFSA